MKNQKHSPKLMGDCIYISNDVELGENVVIYENNRIEGKCHIGDNVVLLPGNYIVDSNINNGAKIHSSVIEQSIVGENTTVGPYAHLRPNSNLGKNVRVGNFCEIKNSTIGDGTKVSHLTYVGDADVGKNCNIGCGVVFVNYNGKTKSRSTIEDNCFIGCNVNIIAPVNIASRSYICAGTTVTDGTEKNDFVIGRVRPTIKHNYSQKYFKDED
jgi:bifunctional UDP-N-acetylglucosamine pyrophosphorylase/glucosamine-1-phosphate N-acetyltransferase